jgi:hypothetical protein
VNEHEFHASSAILEDGRKLIATGKAQRWDVIKWAVTINVGLATASIALRDHPNAGSRLFWFALGVAFIAGVLVAHYNNRMKNTRNESVKTEKYLLRNDVDFAAITGRPPQCVGFFLRLATTTKMAGPPKQEPISMGVIVNFTGLSPQASCLASERLGRSRLAPSTRQLSGSPV